MDARQPSDIHIKIVEMARGQGYQDPWHSPDFIDTARTGHMIRYLVRNYESAAGNKTSTLTIAESRQGKLDVSGDFQSEGRNILNPLGFFADTNADESAILGRMQHFLGRCETVIGESYAVRLHRKHPDLNSDSALKAAPEILDNSVNDRLVVALNAMRGYLSNGGLKNTDQAILESIRDGLRLMASFHDDPVIKSPDSLPESVVDRFIDLTQSYQEIGPGPIDPELPEKADAGFRRILSVFGEAVNVFDDDLTIQETPHPKSPTLG